MFLGLSVLHGFRAVFVVALGQEHACVFTLSGPKAGPGSTNIGHIKDNTEGIGCFFAILVSMLCLLCFLLYRLCPLIYVKGPFSCI